MTGLTGRFLVSMTHYKLSPMLALLLAQLTPAPAPVTDLSSFDRLLGQCFAGEIAEGVVDTHCFEPAYGGAHVRDRHRVVAGGKIVYEGETLYSREEGRLTFTYWNSSGGVGHGTATPDAFGICFDGSMRGSADAPLERIGSCWRLDEQGYLVTNNGSSLPVRFRAGAAHF